MEKNEAFRFIQDAATKPQWVTRIRETDPENLTVFANEHGYECTFEEMQRVSRELLKGSDKEVSKSELEEAESSSFDGNKESGYGADSGFAIASGVAAEILKKKSAEPDDS